MYRKGTQQKNIVLNFGQIQFCVVRRMGTKFNYGTTKYFDYGFSARHSPPCFPCVKKYINKFDQVLLSRFFLPI